MTIRTEYPYIISEDDLSKMISGQERELSPICKAHLRMINTRYDILGKEERDDLILQILKYLDTEAHSRTGEQNLMSFERGWDEIYEKCKAEGISFSALSPQYLTQKPRKYFRLNGDYAVSETSNLVDELAKLVILDNFWTYLQDVNNIYEFGCGTGLYIYLLSELFPEKSLVGLDWTRASQKILGLMAQDERKVTGYHFDMLKPDYSFMLPPKSAVVTIAALEQLSNQYLPFLDYVISQKPTLVIHHEPIEELYDGNKLFDFLGLQYHKKRGYLSGYLSKLQEYEKKGLLKIKHIRRIPLGNQHCEAISTIVWEPLLS